MPQRTGGKKLVSYSDDDDGVPESPSPVGRKARNRHDESEEETVSSGDGFINDEAEDVEDESGSEAVESDNGHLRLKHSTPPVQRRRPAKYRVDSDEEEENIPKARHYRTDDPASPKKKTVASTNHENRRRVVVISDEEDEEDYHASSKKPGLKAGAASRRREQRYDDENEEEKPRRRSKKVATDEENNEEEKPQRRIKKSATETIATPAKSKKQVKNEVSSDSDIEIVETPRSVSKGKGNKDASTPKKGTQGKSPKKKPAPKSKATVEDSDEDIVVAASKLTPGDTMYPEKRTSKVLPGNLKRSLPVTPPYKTRASGLVSEQSTLTPSKKQRKDVGDDVQDYPNGESDFNDRPANKTSTADKAIAGDDGDDHPVHVKSERSDIENNDDNVFDAAPASTQAKSSGSTLKQKIYPFVLNQKYTDRRWSALPRPAVCEVHDPNLLDEALNAAHSYDKLVPLRYCDVQNSGQLYTGALTGTIFWSAWNNALPERDVAKLVPLLEFQNDGRFVNLSRVDPSLLAGRYMSDSRHELIINDQTAICITVGCVRDSALAPDASFGGPFITRGVRLVFSSLEWERWGSTIGEIARRPVLKTQLWNFAVTFGTRLIRREDGPSSSTRRVDNLPSVFFNTYQSPRKKEVAGASSAVHLPNFVGQLEFTDEIPVYDARDLSKDFKWSASVFQNPASYFPKFDLFNNGGEIPSNALCAVGYVTQIYHVPADRDTSSGKGKGKSKVTDDEPQDLRIAPLIQWVYVLGTL